MTLEGTVRNGQIVLTTPTKLPDGTRVRVEPVDEEEFEHPHPMAPYDREKELAVLRESIEEAKTGQGGMPFEEFMAGLARKLNFPPDSSE